MKHLMSFWDSVLEKRLMISSSSPAQEFQEKFDKRPNVFDKLQLLIKPVQGGCGVAKDTEFTGMAYKIYCTSPGVKNNNCGLECVKQLTHAEFSYVEEKNY